MLLLPLVVAAQSNPERAGISNPATSFEVINPLKFNSICGLIKGLIDAAIVIGIPIAVLFIVYAGFKFVIAQGNSEKLKDARKNFLYTIIGIAIFLGSWVITEVIVNTVKALGVPGVGACN